MEQLIACHKRADTDPALVVALRNGINHHNLVFDSLQLESRLYRLSGIAELSVNFIGEEVEIMLLHHIPDFIELLIGIDGTGGIIGITDENSFGGRSDPFFKLFDGRQPESLFNRTGKADDPRPGGFGEGHIIGVGRFRENHLIARIESGEEREEHCLGSAARYDYFLRRDFDSVPAVILRHLAAHTVVSVTGGILEHCPVDVLEYFKSLARRGQIRLPDVERQYLDSLGMSCGSKRSQLSDRRCRHNGTAP